MASTPNILIAEDENIIAIDIANTIKRLGYKVAGTARKGPEVIEKAIKLKPDLVIMDIILVGDMTGIEAAQIIISTLDIPVIYLTALTDEETLQKAKVTEPFGYIIKPFERNALHTSIEMALYKHKMNSELKRRTMELEKERDKTNNLLRNIFPASIADELKVNGYIQPREFSCVTLLFTDFQGFTSLASNMSPTKLVEELNDIFKIFDSIIEKHNVEKLKTIGDSYLIGGGLPIESDQHAVQIISTALDMIGYLTKRNESSVHKWKMRVGIHSGSAVAGIVGKNKFTYDVWGSTVNIASVMEKKSLPGKINITSATYELIKDHFKCNYHEKIEIFGNGLIDTYFVEGRKTGE